MLAAESSSVVADGEPAPEAVVQQAPPDPPPIEAPRAVHHERVGDAPPKLVASDEASKDEESAEKPAGDQPAPGAVGVPEDRRPLTRGPRLLRQPHPDYPEEFAGTGLTAEVIVSMIVDRMGRASHVRVEQSPDQAFTDAALESLAKTEFLPALRSGKITNSSMRMSVVVTEEFGDRAYLAFPGGRIVLEGTNYGGEHDVPVRRLFGLRPAFPFDLLVDGKSGDVLVDFTIDGGPSGADEGVTPRDIAVIQSTHPEFAFAAQGALVHWRFSPAMFGNRPVPVRLRYRFSFRSDEVPEDLRNLARSLAIGKLEGMVPTRMLDEQPSLTFSIRPSPPPDALGRDWRRRRVTVNVVLNELGEVRLPRVVSAPDPLSGYIALAAVGYWHFEPAKKNKTPVPVNVSFPVVF